LCALSLVTALASLVASGTARGQDLYRLPGDVRLEPVDGEVADSALVGLDAEGFVYVATHESRSPYLCYHPTDRAGTERVLLSWSREPGPSIVISAHGVDPGGAGLMLLRFDREGRVELFRLQCSDAPLGDVGQRDPEPFVALQAADNPVVRGEDLRHVGSPVSSAAFTADSACLSFESGVWCLQPEGAGHELRLRRSWEDLQAELDPSPYWWHERAVDRYQPVSSERWFTRALLSLPDGSLAMAALLELRFARPDPTLPVWGLDVRWILRLPREGPLQVLLGPSPLRTAQAPIAPVFEPLHGLRELHYHPGWDALLVWPIQRWEWGGWQIDLGPRGDDAGWQGQGIHVLPLNEPGRGYLSLSDAVLRHRRCDEGGHAGGCSWAAQDQLMVRPDGELWLLMANNVDGMGATSLHRVAWDPETLDLDRDGLTDAQERAAGSSPWRFNSDGGVVEDDLEVLVAGSDPADSVDDPAPVDQELLATSYAASQLIRLRLPDMEYDRLHPSWGVKGPFCAWGQCTDAAGQVVATYDDPPSSHHSDTPILNSIDGSFAVLQRDYGNPDDGLWGLRFADGHTWPITDEATLDEHFPTHPARVLPVSEEEIWLFHPYSPALVLVRDGDGSLRRIYDHEQARCDSGLGPCDEPLRVEPTQPVHDVFDSFEVVGYLEATGEVLLGVSGVWDRYLVALHASGTARVLRHAPALSGILQTPLAYLPFAGFEDRPLRPRWPQRLVPTGHGDYLDANGPLGPHLERLVPNSYLYWSAFSVPASATGMWGDTLVSHQCCDTVQDGYWEWVRYEHRVEPGDTLWVDRFMDRGVGSMGTMLYRIGPRGGASPLWDKLEQEMGHPVGMDATAHGSVCIADATNGRVWDYESANALHVPNVLRRWVSVGAIADCQYAPDDDETLYVLLRDPPRIEVLHPDSLQPELDELLPEDSRPIQLLRLPDGQRQVVDARDGFLGATVSREGRLISLREDHPYDVQIDEGLTLGTLPGAWCFAPDLDTMEERPPSGLAHVVERPDGRVVVMYYWIPADQPTANMVWFTPLMLLDPDTQRVLFAAQKESSFRRGGAITAVPGGDPRDPWTGQPYRATHWGEPVVEVEQARWTEPQVPVRGEPFEEPSGDSGGGCAVGGRRGRGEAGPRWGWWLVGGRR